MGSEGVEKGSVVKIHGVLYNEKYRFETVTVINLKCIIEEIWSVWMDLKDFYFQNIKETEYHYRFYDSIKNVNKIYNIYIIYIKL